MQKLFRCVMASAFLAVAAVPAVAGELSLSIANGRVTLIARDVPVHQILSEWARVGQTRIVNGEKVVGPPVTLELRDVPEAKALEAVLRSASGYVLAPRPAAAPGASMYDRIMILATSRAPAVAVSNTPAFNRPPQPPPMQMPVDDDDGEPKDQGVMPPNVQPGNTPGAFTPGQPMPGPVPGQQTPAQAEQPVLTAPRPGLIPQPPTVPGQGPVPGQPVRKPGGGGEAAR